jgi:hypothetical protein
VPPCSLGEPHISSFLIAYYVLSWAAIGALWLKGGRPERLTAGLMVLVFPVSYFLHPLRMGPVMVGDAALDIAMTVFFAWLALTRERWWPLVMTGTMVLTLLVHAAMLLMPHLDTYSDISARIGLGILSSLILLAGAGERWLAGERASIDLRALRIGARLRDDKAMERHPSRPS